MAPAEVVQAVEQLFTDLCDTQDAEVYDYLALGLVQEEDTDVDELR